MEVLELERWCKSDTARDHFKRLFACTILLRIIAISAATIIQMARSSMALGSQASRLALGFLLWLHGKQSHPMQRPFVSFGVLLLQIQEGLPGPPETCAWVEEDEKLARQQLGDAVDSAKWLAATSGRLSPAVGAVLEQMRHRLSK